MAAASRRCFAARLLSVRLASADVFIGGSSHFTAAAAALILRRSSALSSARVTYPEVKPEYPPGSWGDLSPRVAWKWYEKGRTSSSVQSVQERLISLETAAPQNRYKVYALSRQPRLLAYRQYITKTHVIHGLPEVYRSPLPVQVNLDALQRAVEDVLADERVKLKRPDPQAPALPTGRPFVPIDKIVTTLLIHLSVASPRLCGDQVDRNVISRSCWYRKMPREVVACRGQSRDIDETCVRYMYTGEVSLQIRSEKPLADVVPLTDNLCRGSYPAFTYSPSCVGQFTELCAPRQLPGFLYGDPCQYTATAMLDCSVLEPMRVNADMYHEALVGAGVVLPFGLLAGEAYYDGFTQYDDVAHPMTMQSIITDGREFMFSVYQLNTLRLFVDDVANPLRNLCWVSGTSPVKLYEDVSPEGKVIGFNKDVLLQLVAFLLREQKHSHVCQQPLPAGELFPYRPQYERWTNLPVLLEGSVNIPTAVKYTRGRRSDGRPHGSKKTLLNHITGKRVVVSSAN